MEKKYSIGTVCLVGKSNVGKSSLINALIREKVSIVSPKPQTTRDNIRGVYTDDDSQIIFIDTPGLFKSDSRLGDAMNKGVREARDGADVVLVLVDGSKGIKEEDITFISSFEKFDNVILVVTKTDLTTFEKLYPHLDKVNKLAFLKDIVPISSHKNRNLNVLLECIKKLLPKGTQKDLMFDADIFTNKSVKFMAGEIIREKLLLFLDDEVPHGIAIHIYKWEEGYSLAKIYVDIICDKERHKPLIIGKKGSMLKKVGQSARIDIEKMLGKQVYLELFVKVKENWKNNLDVLATLKEDNEEDY